MKADPELVRRLQRQVGDLLAAEQKTRRAAGRPELTGEAERQAGREFIQTAVTSHRSMLVEQGRAPMSWEVEEALLQAMEARIFGAGDLQHLLENSEIENIDINGFDNVWVTYADGRREQVDPVAQSDADLIEAVQVLAAHAGLASRPFDSANPELDLRLPDGSRLSAIQQNTPRPAVSIRRHRYMKVRLGDLVSNETMNEELADYLAHAVKANLNIMISGATNSGKTTLLRALATEFDPLDRVITIERALELGLDHDAQAHPDLVVMEESLPNAEGHGGVPMSQLLRRTLRMNPDRVIVGEVLGPEIVTMLNAMSQGNDGSLSTIHARSARATFERIAVYAKQAGEALDLEATAQLIASGLDLVVFLKRDETGNGSVRRTVREVLEVNGFNGTTPTASTLFADDGTGRAVRNVDVPLSPHHAEAMRRAGWQPPRGQW